MLWSVAACAQTLTELVHFKAYRLAICIHQPGANLSIQTDVGGGGEPNTGSSTESLFHSLELLIRHPEVP